MISYPKWWDTTLTIFNKYEDPLTNLISWYKHSIDGCFWKNTQNKISIGGTELETNNIISRIPQQSNYLPRGDWEQLPNDKMNQFFTLSSGDIVIKGNIDVEIDEYTQGKRSNDIIGKYKRLGECMVVDASSDNTGVSRCDPHYYITGA